MAIKPVLSVLSGLIFLFAFYPYIKAILKGETKPRKATWLIWMVGDFIIVAGMIASDTISGQMIGACIGATVTFVLSIVYGKPGWEMRDKVCIATAGAALVLWMYFGESNLGIGFSLLALSIAAWPTFIGELREPGTEDRRAWMLFSVSSFVALLAIPQMMFADVAPPIVFMVIDGAILGAVLFNKSRVLNPAV